MAHSRTARTVGTRRICLSRGEELSPPDAFDDLEPDEEHFQEATGNEGASFERTYRRAALVLWPRSGAFAVVCQAGLRHAAVLQAIVQRCEDASQTADWQEAHEFASHMIDQWRSDGWHPRQDTGASNAARMLGLLTRLADSRHRSLRHPDQRRRRPRRE